MTNLCFVVPAHGRLPLARVCLTNLARVCHEVGADAIVVACDENVALARELGFHVVRAPNDYLGQRFNAGFVAALRDLKREYVIPLGSDDLITPRYVRCLLQAGASRTHVGATQAMSALSPAGELAILRIPYAWGPGPRLFHQAMLSTAGYRPADELRARAIDSSIKRNLEKTAPYRLGVVYADTDPLDLVDVKTDGANLNTFEMLLPYATRVIADPWSRLRDYYPDGTVDALLELRA